MVISAIHLTQETSFNYLQADLPLQRLLATKVPLATSLHQMVGTFVMATTLVLDPLQRSIIQLVSTMSQAVALLLRTSQM